MTKHIHTQITKQAILNRPNNTILNSPPPDISPEEETLLELLIVLIERFEEQYYPIPQGTPNSMLKHLMESNNYQPSDLVEVIGSRQEVLELMEGQGNFSQSQSQKLADFFEVEPELFLR